MGMVLLFLQFSSCLHISSNTTSIPYTGKACIEMSMDPMDTIDSILSLMKNICFQTAFTRWRHILKTVKNVTDRPFTQKRHIFCRKISKTVDFENGTLTQT